MWLPKNKKKEEEALVKLYLNDHGYQNYQPVSQEKPDVIVKLGNIRIGFEVTMLADTWVMRGMATNGKAEANENLDKKFTTENKVLQVVQKIINEKNKKGFINLPKGAKRILLIYNNCPFVSINSIKNLRSKIDRKEIDEISVRVERDLINGPEKDVWINL